MGVHWTPEREQRVAKLWEAGLSASQIASDIGYVSRCAVMGKVLRMNLTKRRAPAIPPEEKESRGYLVRMEKNARKRERRRLAKLFPGESRPSSRALATPSPRPPEPVPELRIVDLAPRALRLVDLEPNDCRYPDGGTTEQPEFTFCGHPKHSYVDRFGTLKTSAWCTPHHFRCVGAGIASERSAGRAAA